MFLRGRLYSAVSSHYIKGMYCEYNSSLVMLTLVTWPRGCLSGFSPSFLEGSHSAQPTFKSGETRPISRRPEYLYKVFCVLLYGRFVLFFSCICSAIYLYQQGLSCFIHWVIVQYYLLILLLRLFQLWPLGALSVGSCVPLPSLLVDQLID